MDTLNYAREWQGAPERYSKEHVYSLLEQSKYHEIRGRGVTVAYRPFKPGGGGSNPSGPDVTSGTTTNGGTKVLAAAHLALNQAGEGSSPSGPTDTVIS